VGTNIENALARLRADFKARAESVLDDLEEALRQTDFDDSAGLEAFARRLYGDVHSLKGSGGTAGFHFVSKVSHRLEDYLAARDGQIAAADVPALHKFMDTIRDSLDGQRPADDSEAQQILASLPAPTVPDALGAPAEASDAHAARQETAPSTATPAAGEDLKALLVGLSKTERAIATRALEIKQVSVTALPTAGEALGAVLRLRPDIVLLSGIMSELNATDFVAALRAMEPTRHARVGIMTSLPRNHAALKRLPPDCRVFRQSGKLIQDIESFLDSIVPDARPS